LEEFGKFTECQIALFGNFPTKNYHFLFQILPYNHYHGVEHADSTVITLGPDYAFNSEKTYNDFLGVSSHELFHTWNITRLRPVEMMPYDFFNENYFNTGFIAEGITTYYGDYLLKRSGVFSIKQYLKELNAMLKRHFDNAGRWHASLAESSVDLWLDGYSKGIPGRKVSIYIKGALTALLLDLTLRWESKGKKSLDDVMRLMWQQYSKTGYRFEEYQNVVNEVAGKDMTDYFLQYISGKKPLENILSELFSKFGLKFNHKEAEHAEERYFGMKLQFTQGKLKVTDLAALSPAMQQLEIGDEIIALNHVRPSKKYRELFKEASEVQIHFFSNEQLKEAILKKGDDEFYTIYEVEVDKSADKDVQLLQKQWLGDTE
jgi:predicted metalloprotease with PDZ domain